MFRYKVFAISEDDPTYMGLEFEVEKEIINHYTDDCPVVMASNWQLIEI